MIDSGGRARQRQNLEVAVCGNFIVVRLAIIVEWLPIGHSTGVLCIHLSSLIGSFHLLVPTRDQLAQSTQH